MDENCQYLPLERGYDFKADYERELQALMDRRAAIVSFNNLTERQRELYGTFDEELTEEGPAYTPTLFTKLWAVDRAEQGLKVRAWYPHLMWMLKKKGYEVEYVEEPAEEEETVDDAGSDIVKGVSNAADAIAAQEIEDMSQIDATELDDEWEDVMNKQNARDMLLREDKLAIRKYRAQKYFISELTGEDVVFFEKHKKAILYRILVRDATAGELYAKNVLEVERARLCDMEDVIGQDYKIRKDLSKLVVEIGYTGGLQDHTTELCLKEVWASDAVKLGVGRVQKLVAGPTNNGMNTTLAGVLRPWLLKYIGLTLQARQSGKHNKRSMYKMKPCPGIQEFSRRENTVYERVFGRKRSEPAKPTVQAVARGGAAAGGGAGARRLSRVGTEPQAMNIRQFVSVKRRASCCP